MVEVVLVNADPVLGEHVPTRLLFLLGRVLRLLRIDDRLFEVSSRDHEHAFGPAAEGPPTGQPRFDCIVSGFALDDAGLCELLVQQRLLAGSPLTGTELFDRHPDEIGHQVHRFVVEPSQCLGTELRRAALVELLLRLRQRNSVLKKQTTHARQIQFRGLLAVDVAPLFASDVEQNRVRLAVQIVVLVVIDDAVLVSEIEEEPKSRR